MDSLKGQSIVIQGWMIESGLLERNEIFIYAIIYSYSQGGKGIYYGTKSNLEKWTGYKKRQIRNILISLEDKGLIKREIMIKNKIEYVCYTALTDKFFAEEKQEEKVQEKEHNKRTKNRFNNCKTRKYSKEYFEKFAEEYYN